MSIRFRPKRRASMDQTPGPSIASAAPTVASTMQVRRLSALEAAVRSSTTTTSTPAIGVNTPLSRGLQIDNSALQPDSDGVGSVVRTKFREDVLDVSLNGFLGDRQLSCDQFVGVAGGNGPKNFDFP